MSVLARTSGGVKRKKSKVGAGMGVPATVAALIGVGLVSWGIGARTGYGFAQQDAAAIMQDTSGRGYQQIAWRGWMAGSQQYEPPSDLSMLMALAGGTIPGTGGMTTGDIWNGYQMRMQREFFRDSQGS